MNGLAAMLFFFPEEQRKFLVTKICYLVTKNVPWVASLCHLKTKKFISDPDLCTERSSVEHTHLTPIYTTSNQGGWVRNDLFTLFVLTTELTAKTAIAMFD